MRCKRLDKAVLDEEMTRKPHDDGSFNPQGEKWWIGRWISRHVCF